MARGGLAVLAAMVAAACGAAAADTAPPSDPALAQAIEQLHGFYISDGEQIVLRPGPDGRATVVSRDAGLPPSVPPPASDTKVEGLYHFRIPSALKAGPGTVAAAFSSFAGRGVALRVDNGLSQPVLYDASIVTRRGGATSVTPTSICPVGPGRVGVESWGPNVVGLIISNVRTPPEGDARCSEGSGLVAHTVTANPNICRGGAQDAAVQVDLEVDPVTGGPMNASAVWNLRAAPASPLAPWIALNYPMQNGMVGGRPDGATVLAVVSLQGHRPTAKTASIVLSAGGVEAARRPWRLYASQMAQIDRTPADSKPVAFVGAVPIPLRGPDGAADPGLERLFAAIGEGKVRSLEVRAEGDDGSVIVQAAFDLSSADIQDAAKVSAALRDAQAKAQAPDHCRPPPSAGAG